MGSIPPTPNALWKDVDDPNNSVAAGSVFAAVPIL